MNQEPESANLTHRADSRLAKVEIISAIKDVLVPFWESASEERELKRRELTRDQELVTKELDNEAALKRLEFGERREIIRWTGILALILLSLAGVSVAFGKDHIALLILSHFAVGLGSYS